MKECSSLAVLLLVVSCLLIGCQPTVCGDCRKKPATVFLTQFIDGKSVKRDLCEECAQKAGMLPSTPKTHSGAER